MDGLETPSAPRPAGHGPRPVRTTLGVVGGAAAAAALALALTGVMGHHGAPASAPPSAQPTTTMPIQATEPHTQPMPTTQPQDMGFTPAPDAHNVVARFGPIRYLITGGTDNLNTSIGMIAVTTVYPDASAHAVLYATPERSGAVQVDSTVSSTGDVGYTINGAPSSHTFNIISGKFH